MKTHPHYPTRALNYLIYFLNTNLPYPLLGFNYMNRFMEKAAYFFLKEVESTLKTLPSEEVGRYAKWLNQRMSNFNCIFCETYYDPITESPRVSHLHPPLNQLLLNDPNPEISDFKHKLCHKTIAYQNRLVEYLDDEVWKKHPGLDAGRWG